MKTIESLGASPLTPKDLLRAAFDQAVRCSGWLPCPHLTQLEPIEGRAMFLVVGKAASSKLLLPPSASVRLTGYVLFRRATKSTPVSMLSSLPSCSDEGSLAAEQAFELARSIGPSDRLVCLISGGGSALMSAPLPSMDPDLKMRTHQALLASGATISELNTVRKQLSMIKGGRLAEACQGQIVNFLVSDVPGDRAEFIASGPTVPANTNQQDAIDVLVRHQIDILDDLLPWLNDARHATPAPDSDCFRRVKTTIVAAPSQSLGAAKSLIESQGVDCWVLGDAIEGDSETIARVMADTALWQQRHQKLDRPLCLLSGGETTVKVTGAGVGGPNAHFALALLDALDGARGISAIVCDTDGVDGAAEIAGACIDDDSGKSSGWARSSRCPSPPRCAHFLSIFGLLGDLPDGANVNDFKRF